MKAKKNPKEDKTTSEKPVSLYDAKFENVVAALLKTPKSKKDEKEENGSKKR